MGDFLFTMIVGVFMRVTIVALMISLLAGNGKKKKGGKGKPHEFYLIHPILIVPFCFFMFWEDVKSGDMLIIPLMIGLFMFDILAYLRKGQEKRQKKSANKKAEQQKEKQMKEAVDREAKKIARKQLQSLANTRKVHIVPSSSVTWTKKN